MLEKTYRVPQGDIHYWSSHADPGKTALVFLPGLTADHRLFARQLEEFEERYNLLVWDAPGHNASRPFRLDFTLADKAAWLHDILLAEGIESPVLIGQSMGGYVSQSFMEQFPGEAKAFVSIDSAPLQRKYVTAAEIWLLKRTEIIYRPYPWKSLLRAGAKGCAETEYGRALMQTMMTTYDKREYCALTCHGYRMLAEAMEANLPYRIDCPALLLCGEHDAAGSTRRYNRRWTQEAGLPIRWIPDAGHNSNTDRPRLVNRIIEEFLEACGVSHIAAAI